MFDDVIRWLLMGLGQQTKAEKKWVEAHLLRLPTDDEQIRKARRVLEGAALALPCVAVPEDGKFYRVAFTIKYMPEGVVVGDMSILAVLPDAPKGEK